MRDRLSDLPIRFEAVDYRVGPLAILSGMTLDDPEKDTNMDTLAREATLYDAVLIALARRE